MHKTERFEELDALRGLAALVVFVYHCIFLFAVCPPLLAWAIRTPLGLLIYGGHQAVILFFILSGFVLYLPYTRPRYTASYKAFLVKRVCRIYLPYLGALVFFVLAYVIFFKAQRPEGVSELYGWRQLSWGQGVALFRDHVLFLGFYHRDYWNNATWTLAEEMRISMIYPLLAIMVVRFRSRSALLVALACSTAVSVVIHVVHHRTPFEPFHYASLFVLGAVLASNREQLVGTWKRAGKPMQTLAACGAVLIASYAMLLMTWFPAVITEEASDWLIAVSVSVILLAALAETWFTKFLRRGLMVHFGRISYGIYLLHLPILFVFVSLLWNRVSPLIVFGLSLASTLALAELFHMYLEQPSMALGKRLANGMQRRRAQEQAEMAGAIRPTGSVGTV